MQFENLKILLVGDVMLDRYIYGDVNRVSPEAPVPVLHAGGTTSTPGAAANCARNVTSLGAKVTLVSVVGDDENGRTILDKIAQDHLIRPYIFSDFCRKSTVKTRYLCNNHQMLRVDYEDHTPIRDSMLKRLISVVKSEIEKHDIVILSDYDKGVLTPFVLAEIIGEARRQKKMIIVDPKKTDWRVYAGATVVTPNLHEWFIASGVEYDPKAVAEKLMECGIENVIVTRSKAGMTLVERSGIYTDIPAVTQHIIDVTGAGDTAVAVLSLGMASGETLIESARLANKAAGIVVGKPRTATVEPDELFASKKMLHHLDMVV